MKKTLSLFVLFLASACLTLAQPFTSSVELLQANIAKTGGEKWNTIQTAKISASITMSFNEEEVTGTTTQSTQFPGHQRIDYKITTPMGEMVGKSVITPGKAWMENDMMGKQELEGEETPPIQPLKDELQLIEQADSLTLDLKDEDFEGKSYHAVKILQDEKVLETRYYDKETLLLHAAVSSSDEFSSVTIYSDYQSVDGLTFCFQEKSKIISAEGEQAQDKKIDKIELNIALDEALFIDN